MNFTNNINEEWEKIPDWLLYENQSQQETELWQKIPEHLLLPKSNGVIRNKKRVRLPKIATKITFTCSICLDQIKKNQANALTCGHVFHEKCSNEWQKRGNGCAVCRL
jgi:hypothetical protein